MKTLKQQALKSVTIYCLLTGWLAVAEDYSGEEGKGYVWLLQIHNLQKLQFIQQAVAEAGGNTLINLSLYVRGKTMLTTIQCAVWRLCSVAWRKFPEPSMAPAIVELSLLQDCLTEAGLKQHVASTALVSLEVISGIREGNSSSN